MDNIIPNTLYHCKNNKKERKNTFNIITKAKEEVKGFLLLMIFFVCFCSLSCDSGYQLQQYRDHISYEIVNERIHQDNLQILIAINLDAVKLFSFTRLEIRFQVFLSVDAFDFSHFECNLLDQSSFSNIDCKAVPDENYIYFESDSIEGTSKLEISFSKIVTGDMQLTMPFNIALKNALEETIINKFGSVIKLKPSAPFHSFIELKEDSQTGQYYYKFDYAPNYQEIGKEYGIVENMDLLLRLPYLNKEFGASSDQLHSILTEQTHLEIIYGDLPGKTRIEFNYEENYILLIDLDPETTNIMFNLKELLLPISSKLDGFMFFIYSNGGQIPVESSEKVVIQNPSANIKEIFNFKYQPQILSVGKFSPVDLSLSFSSILAKDSILLLKIPRSTDIKEQFSFQELTKVTLNDSTTENIYEGESKNLRFKLEQQNDYSVLIIFLENNYIHFDYPYKTIDLTIDSIGNPLRGGSTGLFKADIYTYEEEFQYTLKEDKSLLVEYSKFDSIEMYFSSYLVNESSNLMLIIFPTITDSINYSLELEVPFEVAFPYDNRVRPETKTSKCAALTSKDNPIDSHKKSLKQIYELKEVKYNLDCTVTFATKIIQITASKGINIGDGFIMNIPTINPNYSIISPYISITSFDSENSMLEKNYDTIKIHYLPVIIIPQPIVTSNRYCSMKSEYTIDIMVPTTVEKGDRIRIYFPHDVEAVSGDLDSDLTLNTYTYEEYYKDKNVGSYLLYNEDYLTSQGEDDLFDKAKYLEIEILKTSSKTKKLFWETKIEEGVINPRHMNESESFFYIVYNNDYSGIVAASKFSILDPLMEDLNSYLISNGWLELTMTIPNTSSTVTNSKITPISVLGVEVDRKETFYGFQNSLSKRGTPDYTILINSPINVYLEEVVQVHIPKEVSIIQTGEFSNVISVGYYVTANNIQPVNFSIIHNEDGSNDLKIVISNSAYYSRGYSLQYLSENPEASRYQKSKMLVLKIYGLINPKSLKPVSGFSVRILNSEEELMAESVDEQKIQMTEIHPMVGGSVLQADPIDRTFIIMTLEPFNTVDEMNSFENEISIIFPAEFKIINNNSKELFCFTEVPINQDPEKEEEYYLNRYKLLDCTVEIETRKITIKPNSLLYEIRHKSNNNISHLTLGFKGLISKHDKITSGNAYTQSFIVETFLIDDPEKYLMERLYGSMLEYFFECTKQCAVCEPIENICTKCFDNVQSQLLYRGTCLENCPDKSSLDYNTNTCLECNERCLTCLPSDLNLCITCKPEYYFLVDLYQCVDSCPTGYYLNVEEQKCIKCRYPCQECLSENFCTACDKTSSMLYQNKCYYTCPELTYKAEIREVVKEGEKPSLIKEFTCLKCHDNCKTCDKKADLCISCNLGLFIHESRCVKECPSGYTYNQIKKGCIECPIGCHSCTLQENMDNERKYSFVCSSCGSSYFLKGNSCTLKLSSCPPQLYIDPGLNECRPCPANCLTCISEKQCTSCMVGNLQKGSCANGCKEGQFLDTHLLKCSSCLSTCKTCDESAGNCTSCSRDKILHRNKCLSTCPDGYYLDVQDNALSDIGKCYACPKNCNQCYLAVLINNVENTVKCSSCQKGFYRNPSFECTPLCPEGFKQDSFSSTCKLTNERKPSRDYTPLFKMPNTWFIGFGSEVLLILISFFIKFKRKHYNISGIFLVGVCNIFTIHMIYTMYHYYTYGTGAFFFLSCCLIGIKYLLNTGFIYAEEIHIKKENGKQNIGSPKILPRIISLLAIVSDFKNYKIYTFDFSKPGFSGVFFSNINGLIKSLRVTMILEIVVFDIGWLIVNLLYAISYKLYIFDFWLVVVENLCMHMLILAFKIYDLVVNERNNRKFYGQVKEDTEKTDKQVHVSFSIKTKMKVQKQKVLQGEIITQTEKEEENENEEGTLRLRNTTMNQSGTQNTRNGLEENELEKQMTMINNSANISKGQNKLRGENDIQSSIREETQNGNKLQGKGSLSEDSKRVNNRKKVVNDFSEEIQNNEENDKLKSKGLKNSNSLKRKPNEMNNFDSSNLSINNSQLREDEINNERKENT